MDGWLDERKRLRQAAGEGGGENIRSRGLC
jgi:hypothetical protein